MLEPRAKEEQVNVDLSRLLRLLFLSDVSLSTYHLCGGLKVCSDLSLTSFPESNGYFLKKGYFLNTISYI